MMTTFCFGQNDSITTCTVKNSRLLELNSSAILYRNSQFVYDYVNAGINIGTSKPWLTYSMNFATRSGRGYGESYIQNALSGGLSMRYSLTKFLRIEGNFQLGYYQSYHVIYARQFKALCGIIQGRLYYSFKDRWGVGISARQLGAFGRGIHLLTGEKHPTIGGNLTYGISLFVKIK